MTVQSASRSLAVQVFPSSAAIPENLLRFHLRFAQPVDAIDPNAFIRLCDSAGGLIEHAFVDLPDGLWDADASTLTVMMHPGRIKHGLHASKQLGLALEAQSSYVLQVNLQARVEGAPAEHAADWRTVHTFKARPAINEAIDLSKWSLLSPPPHSVEPLRVRFDRPLDCLSVETCLQVLDGAGRALEGTIATVFNETGAEITPLGAWVPGAYNLLVHHEIEDAVGNRIGSAFETLSGSAHGHMQSAQAYSLPFTVG
jgi:hypothetical protein